MHNISFDEVRIALVTVSDIDSRTWRKQYTDDKLDELIAQFELVATFSELIIGRIHKARALTKE